MNSFRIFHSIIFMLLLFVFSSCTRHYFDTVKYQSDQPVVKGTYFYIFPDSIIFRYKNNVVLTRDSEKIHPRSFTLKLPVKLKFYYISASTDFSFYYDKNQVVYIKIDLENGIAKDRLIDSPLADQVGDFIASTKNGRDGKYNIKKIPFDKNRKSLLLKIGKAQMLLYNIETKNIQLFSEYIRGLKFID